ncbi:MAG TPA: DUF2207 domain-containing protein [Candidatus Nanopelagicales bacterium]|nr:DUF2207 domain-containing protein [Candidatus Nanopelagicales bacterium]
MAKSQRMTPRVTAAAATVVVLVLVLIGAVALWIMRSGTSSSSGSVSDPVTIVKYDASFTVSADGTLHAVETIDADFPYGRHGIFRYWDEVDPSDPSARYPVTILSILRDGSPDNVAMSRDGTVVIAKIGDAGVVLDPGVHRYVLSYTVPNVLRPVRDVPMVGATSDGARDGTEQSVFAWWVVASNWEMAIQEASVRVTLPSPVTQGLCRTPALSGTCTVTGAGTSTITVTAQGLDPRTGVEVAAYSAAPPSPSVSLPWGARWDQFLGTVSWLPFLLLLLAGIAGVVGVAWVRSATEQPPGEPLQYEPPPGLGPVQCEYLVSESTGTAALTSTVLHMAEQGMVTLEDHGGSWTVTYAAAAEKWAAADPVARAVGAGLGVDAPGGSFTASATEASGATVRTTITALEHAARSWSDEGLWRSDPMVWWGRAGVVLSLLAAGILGLVGPMILALPFAVFAVCAAALFATGMSRRRTYLARESWMKAAGFRKFLSTPSSEDRFDFAARGDLWIAYVPYAVGFGCADAWAEKYRAAVGHEPPTPSWYPVHSYYGASMFSSSGGFDSFNAAVASSVAAYTAAHSSSSGGGGGFGGGGGGGGGSW